MQSTKKKRRDMPIAHHAVFPKYKHPYEYTPKLVAFL